MTFSPEYDCLRGMCAPQVCAVVGGGWAGFSYTSFHKIPLRKIGVGGGT